MEGEGVRLTYLIEGLDSAQWQPSDVPVTHITHDSRQVLPGSLFVCLPGRRDDGHRFAADAVRKGAVAVVASRPVDTLGKPLILVPDTRTALSVLAHRYHGDPTRFLKVIGVTGTNGKTTITYLIAHILNQFHRKPVCALLGTTGVFFANRFANLDQTTPDAPELFSQIARVHREGALFLSMEVSSHALDQRRCDACLFDVVVFTNLSHDHLDYHRDIDSYFQAKRRLFTELTDRGLRAGKNVIALINRDDPYGQRLLTVSRGAVRTYGSREDSDYRPERGTLTPSGLSFLLHTPSGSVPIEAPLLGRFNLINVVCSCAVALEMGVPLEILPQAIATFIPPPGRLEPVSVGQPFHVLIDYAHTPDALEKVLDAIREIASGRVIVVFGCGGDRDPTKRPRMGRIAAEKADLTIVTSDNPRTEDPMAIIDQIVTGIPDEATFIVEPDRRKAIYRAVAEAAPGDFVLIAGKGHEDYQIVGRNRYPFSDRRVAAEAVKFVLTHKKPQGEGHSRS